MEPSKKKKIIKLLWIPLATLGFNFFMCFTFESNSGLFGSETGLLQTLPWIILATFILFMVGIFVFPTSSPKFFKNYILLSLIVLIIASFTFFPPESESEEPLVVLKSMWDIASQKESVNFNKVNCFIHPHKAEDVAAKVKLFKEINPELFFLIDYRERVVLADYLIFQKTESNPVKDFIIYFKDEKMQALNENMEINNINDSVFVFKEVFRNDTLIFYGTKNGIYKTLPGTCEIWKENYPFIKNEKNEVYVDTWSEEEWYIKLGYRSWLYKVYDLLLRMVW